MGRKMPDTSILWFQLTFLLVIAVLSHFVFTRFKQPLVIGEIIIGIIIGPSVVGALTGYELVNTEMISVFAQLGAIVLLFMIGLESDLRRIYTKRNFSIALGGVLLPWVAGYFVAVVMVPSVNTAQAIFIGATMVATSVSVTAAVLMEMGMISDEVGCAILGAAVVDDILGMMVLGVAGGFALGGIDYAQIIYLVAAAIVFIVVGIFVGTRYLSRIVCLAEKEGKERGLEHTGFVLAFAFALLFAYISEVIGISAIVGAFLAGTIFSSSVIKSEAQAGTKYLGAIFVPIFFISMGVLFDINGLSELFLFAIVLTILAILTKVIGCGVPARSLGMSGRDALAVGIGMAPRLEVALIIALYGLQTGIIGQGLYSVVVFMGIVTALVTPFLFKLALGKGRKLKPAEKCGAIDNEEKVCQG